MNPAKFFILRPIGTSLLALALVIFGIAAFRALPNAPLPEVEFPTITVRGSLPGADPETMANAVATPLERRLGHIAGVVEMTSISEIGYANIALQFSLDRDINGAARDVQAAIDAAKSDLPPDMPQNPVYYKSNPADAPIMVLSLTSPTSTPARMFDVASTILQQRLLRTEGVGEVGVGGGALPAVRIDVNPDVLSQHGIALAEVRQFLLSASPALALGGVQAGGRQYALNGNDNLLHAQDYRSLYLRTRDGGVMRLTDFARVSDSIEDIRNAGIANGKPAVLLVVYKQPGANVIDTVTAINAQLPFLRASIPADIDISVIGNRTPAIRASLADIEFTLLVSIALVMLVTLAFFRSWRSAVVPSIAVPLALLGTFAVMYLLGFSLNILSLMALAISTGFVVDDAIVVVENVMRHLEQGKTPLQAAIDGTGEVGFTIVSITLSLLAAFIPLLLMGGIVGRLFREFSVSMSVAILLSMVLSLTLTPMMCRVLIHGPSSGSTSAHATAAGASRLGRIYDRTLSWSLDHRPAVLGVALATTVLTGLLFAAIPKGFFPREDTGRISGSLYVSQTNSFQDVHSKLEQVIRRLRQDRDVANVVGYAGTGLVPNAASVFMYLKPEGERTADADTIIARLLASAASIPDIHLYLQPQQDLVIGGRRTAAQYQYTLTAENLAELSHWSGILMGLIRHVPGVTRVTTNAAMGGRGTFVHINRQTAARYQTNASLVDQTLYDAFGQRRLSILYEAGNEYRVVMQADPRYWQDRSALDALRVPTQCTDCEAGPQDPGQPPAGNLVPLSAFAKASLRRAPLLINHTGEFPSETISFDIAPHVALGDVTREINAQVAKRGLPADMTGSFSGAARAFEDSLSAEPLLIAVALVAVYLILGMLYENLVHPLTILSSLPPAGVGALLALSLFHMELNVMALIGLILLIGIVKKNAIMLVDFALTLQREHGHTPRAAIHEACLVRARPILMTTLAALLGALPLVFGSGYGAEFRKPLGLTIIGGLVLSQLVTLYTTPVVYLTAASLNFQRPPRNKHV